MLDEAVEVIRRLWTEDFVTHHGEHHTVENARIYTKPNTPPPIFVSGFGSKSAEVAGRIGDGFMTTTPDQESLQAFRANGGAGKPPQAGYKVCWGTDDDRAVATAHRLWANSGIPGEVSQVLPSPKHFEQASKLVTEQMTRESIAYGDDIGRHVDVFAPYADAGFDEIYISQMGGAEKASSSEGFFDFYARSVLPKIRD
jgi:G6PDH family F420-dependent oxidoreductase